MDVVLVVLGIAVLAVAVGFALKGQPTVLKLDLDLRALANAKCNACCAEIGGMEADDASERSLELGRKHLTAIAMPDHQSFWPVVCPSCGERLVFWLATRELHKASTLVAQRWIREDDLEY